jgi:hypothetical protein
MENLKEMYHLGDLELDETIILTCILGQDGVVVMWTGFSWLSVRSSGGLL